MRADRLMAITMVLMEKDIISASKLADMFDVSVRTIYRDIDTIELAGVPIVTYAGTNGGISVLDNFKLDKSLLTTNDYNSLIDGLENINSLLNNKDKKTVNTLSKLKCQLPKEYKNDIKRNIIIDPKPWFGNDEYDSNIDVINRAIDIQAILYLDYSDNSNRTSSRKVEPYNLLYKENTWYLQAYCLKRSDYRIFKLNRINDIRLLKDKYEVRNDIPKEIDFYNKNKNVEEIVLLIDPSLLEQMLRYVSRDNIKEYNNKYIVNFPFTDDDYSYNILLGFGESCLCLEPKYVKLKLIEKIKNILELYN